MCCRRESSPAPAPDSPGDRRGGEGWVGDMRGDDEARSGGVGGEKDEGAEKTRGENEGEEKELGFGGVMGKRARVLGTATHIWPSCLPASSPPTDKVRFLLYSKFKTCFNKKKFINFVLL